MQKIKLEQIKTELDWTKKELERSQLQFSQLLVELEQYHSELYQTQRELEESERLRKQMRAELDQTQSSLNESHRELEQTKSMLGRVQGELDRYKYKEAIVSESISENEKQYRQLVWDAWQAYRNGDINYMVDCLQKSMKYTPFSRTKTVSNWVKSWREFSQQKGEEFEVRTLNSYREWQQLLRRMTRVKVRTNYF